MIAVVVTLIVAFGIWFAIEVRRAPLGCNDCQGVRDCWACGAANDRARADKW